MTKTWYLFTVLALLSWLSCTDAVLRFAHYYNSHMVLQMEPAKAQIWGYASTNGDVVSVSLNGATVAKVTVQQGKWSTLLPSQTAGTSATITISSKDGHKFISDVLFGDVWVCSGQSNMAFTMSSVFNHSEELAKSTHFNTIRIMHVATRQANHTLEEPAISTRWRKPSNDSATSRFSAVCLLYAMELSPHINRPIGLVETSWGGTHIEVWSSPDAIKKCQATGKRSPPRANTILWNSMVYPLLKMTIYGTIWYQGESNSPKPALYACQFPAMIDDWRAKFNAASKGQTSQQFPFGFVQLGADANVTLHTGFPDIRWSQTAEYGYVPNPRQPNVFMAVAMDLPDFNSPKGSIHPRDKQDVAQRLALAGRAVAYGEKNLDFQGPFPNAFHVHGHTLVIEFDHGNSAIEVRSNNNFEVCCSHTKTQQCSSDWWKAAPVLAHDQSTVTIDTSACVGHRNIMTAVRYAWETSPCDMKKCGVYDQNNDLPAPPFMKYGPF